MIVMQHLARAKKNTGCFDRSNTISWRLWLRLRNLPSKALNSRRPIFMVVHHLNVHYMCRELKIGIIIFLFNPSLGVIRYNLEMV